MTTNQIDSAKPVLVNYKTGEWIRNASPEEQSESVKVADRDGGAGVIEVNGVSCYVAD